MCGPCREPHYRGLLYPLGLYLLVICRLSRGILMCGDGKQAIRDPRDEEKLEEQIQKKRREARLYGYNDLLDDVAR